MYSEIDISNSNVYVLEEMCFLNLKKIKSFLLQDLSNLIFEIQQI